ncbi:MAG: galactokinase [Bacteroidetes bacterium]|nr:MAG: galactokinase [Bacteroidota bacterium]
MKDIQVKKAFEKTFGGEYRFFAAPGRINLIGEHTDYNNGFVLPAAIDKKIYLAIAPVKGSTVKIKSLDFNEMVEFDIHETDAKLPHWAKYPYGVLKEIQADGYFVEGFQAVFAGDIPKGAGLSSSAALESVFAKALNELYGLGIDNLSLAKIGQRAEHNFAGVRCGIMDQFASIHGKKDHVIRLDCRSLEHEYYPLNLDGYQLILADTRVKHSLASSEYNQRRAQCEEGVLILRSNMPAVRSLRDVRPKDVYPYKAMMGMEVFLRCEYVTEENERVLETCDALAKGDMQRVGELLYQSHEGLRKKYHVSCDELDLLVDNARKIDGVMGARMMGGGFGGCTINLIQSSAVDDFKKKSTNAFTEAFGKPPVFYDVNVSDGASEY